MGEGRGVERLLVGKSEGKKPMGKFGHIWYDNITTVFKKRIEAVEWINLPQDKDRGSAMFTLQKKPQGSVICGEFLY
jgi:hypothetical protein